MKLRIDNPNNCLYCGKKLSLYHLLRDLLYCNHSHRSAHVRAQNELGLFRLAAEEKSQSVIRWESGETNEPDKDWIRARPAPPGFATDNPALWTTYKKSGQ